MLTTQLRELEKDGFIVRKIFAEIPPRVEYSITENVKTIFPLLQSIQDWGKSQQSKKSMLNIYTFTLALGVIINYLLKLISLKFSIIILLFLFRFQIM